MVKGLIGVVHLPAMPGDPGVAGDGGFAEVERHALADAEALARGGADGLLIENFGSLPFSKGTRGCRIPPHQVAIMAILARECRERFNLPVGVNCLRNDALSALGIAAASGIDFIRVNVHTGACVTDQGVIEGEAARSLRYRRAVGADWVAILADVLVKHGQPLAPQSPEMAVRECLERGLADGVIVTGEATGAPIARDRLERAHAAARDRLLFLGSGVTPENAATLAPLADGAIVGTWLKRGGDVRAPVDEERVRVLAAALRGRFRGSGDS